MIRAAVRGEGGAGAALVLAVAGAVIAVLGVLLPIHTALAAKQRAVGAADAAALAAADTVSGARSGVPCDAAATLAEANGARLGSCRIDAAVATVEVVTVLLGIEVRAVATAGPPAANTPPSARRTER